MKNSNILSAAIALKGAFVLATEESSAFLRGVDTRRLSTNTVSDCFYDVAKDTVWPLDTDGDMVADDNFGTGIMSLGFGPYESYCTGGEGFHTGVTIHANPDTDTNPSNVCAVYQGEVHAVWGPNSDGLYTVVIEHNFKDGETCLSPDFPGGNGSWYSVYKHLASVEEHITVGFQIGAPADAGGACIKIGEIGARTCNQGETPLRPSLAFEVRYGSPNSYSFCKANPTSTSCPNPPYDPHVNPMLAVYKQSPDFTITVPETPLAYNHENIVTITQPADVLTLNQITVNCEAGSGSQDVSLKSHTIDFNLRDSFDLDNGYDQDMTKPYIDVFASTQWTLKLPAGWVQCELADETKCTVTACDTTDYCDSKYFNVPMAQTCTGVATTGGSDGGDSADGGSDGGDSADS